MNKEEMNPRQKEEKKNAEQENKRIKKKIIYLYCRVTRS